MDNYFAATRLMGGASIFVLMLAADAAQAGGLPSGGHFVSGKGAMGRVAQSLTVTQSSMAGIIDWNSFSIGSKNAVTFNNGSGATLNRVTGNDLSKIAGSLHATGSLYLINSQGVIVSGSGRVVTGGSFVASSGDAPDSDFKNGDKLHFKNVKAEIINRGSIVSSERASLIGSRVASTGTIDAASVTLRAESGGAIAGGTIDAGGSAERNGRILVVAKTGRTKITGNLVARNQDGSGGAIETSGRTLSIGGIVDAGKGGSWLVDPENLRVRASSAKTIDKSLDAGTSVTLKTTATGTSGPGTAVSGLGDIEIEAAMSWDTSATLTLDAYHSVHFNNPVTVARKGKITVVTNDGGTGGELRFLGGDVMFDNLASRLTINGSRFTLVGNIATLASGIASNPSGNYALANNYDASADGTYSASPISATFEGTFEGMGNTISHLTIKQSFGTSAGLFAQIGASGAVDYLNLSAAKIDADAGASVGALAGDFDGSALGITVSGKITGSADIGGLAGTAGEDSVVTNSSSAVEIIAPTTDSIEGGLIGTNDGMVWGSHATGEVHSPGKSDAGGLVGLNQGLVSSSYASGTLYGKGAVGGLIGKNATSAATVVQSYATGRVHDGGGLVGVNQGMISDSNSSGARARDGLVAKNSGTITDSFSTVSLARSGGLVGENTGIIENSYASVTVTGGDIAGGLVEINDRHGKIENSFATGNVSGIDYAGGLVGMNTATIRQSYASGAVSGSQNTGGFQELGGFVAFSGGLISDSYATGSVSSSKKGSYVGGFVGFFNNGDLKGGVQSSYATGSVKGVTDSYVGGFVGNLQGDAIFSNDYADGDVHGGKTSRDGGFAGYMDLLSDSSLSSSYSTGAVTAGATSYVGGFAGELKGTNSLSSDYWDTDTSGISADFGVGNISDVPGVTGLTTAQFQSGLPSGFDNSVWGENSSINGGLPYLLALASSY
jgi:filamentous hemagglutinin family protein